MIAITAGGPGHTCALLSGGGVKCWGNNSFGQIGDGSVGDPHLTPVDVSGLASGVTAITAGYAHTCSVKAGGAKCWGRNYYGQLGDGTTTSRPTPADVSGLSAISEISAGAEHTCALENSGGVKCWGQNAFGQLGDGTVADRHLPVDVLGLPSGVTAIDAGLRHTCSLTSASGVKCWGDNRYGQLGDGTTMNSPAPVDVWGLSSGVSGFSAGDYHTCAVTAAGGVKCWGWNDFGQLGDGTLTSREKPTDVIGIGPPPHRTLTVSATGSGGGTVTSNPAGISCGSVCSYDFTDGDVVTLTASSSAGSSFAGWSGDCSGTGACIVLMNANKTVTATFESDKTLTIAKAGSGAGSVLSSPAGIDCGATCSHAYAHGTSVTSTAAASPGSEFSGWSGDCSGGGACTLAMSANHSATATFESDKTLTVSKAGSGSGAVTSSPPGIDCGATCSHAFTHGTSVTLTATSKSTFTGWSGACSGTGTCSLTMSADHTATAKFQARCIVPKVKGKTLAAAKRAIAKGKCRVGTIRRAYSAKLKKGRVISQKPAPGKKLARGSKVNLVVSKGKK